MTSIEDLEQAMVEAVEREYAARLSGAADLQTMAMNDIRCIRILLDAKKQTASNEKETQDQGGESKSF